MNNLTDIILTHAESVLIPLVPDAEIVGDELVGRNPQRNGDSNPGSFSINLSTGKWADFATDGIKGGDVFSYIAHCMGITKQAARKWAKQQVEGKSAVPVKKAPETGCIMPVPDDAIPRPGNPDRVNGWSAEWEYQNQEGELLFLVRRYEKNGGKEHRTWTCRDNGQWDLKRPPKPWPLYNLPSFNDDDLTVYIAEGEKAADAADKLLDGLGTCTLGGSGGVKDADLSPLHGRHVVIIPDADDAGRKYAQKLINRLQSKTKSLRIVDVWQLGWDGGEDIADIEELPEDWDEATVKVKDWVKDNQPEEAVKKSQATEIVELSENLGFFNWDGIPYADIEVNGHRETWPMKSKHFKEYLAHTYMMARGKVPGDNAIKDALCTLNGKAKYQSESREVFTRVGEYKKAIYIDMCNDQWQAIRIDADGWSVVDNSSIRFIRRKGMHPLPIPDTDGDAHRLFKYVNLHSKNDEKLVLGWLVQTIRPEGPYPLLIFQGEQGTAKTTACRVMVRLIDPKVAETRTRPRNEHDLLIAAQNGWVISLDNLSGISSVLSDALCRLATGGGFSTRELFTDTDEILIDVKRPATLNGIDDVAVRPDLIDRSIVLTLAPIAEKDRKSESVFWREFNQDAGKILGGLLDGVSTALRELPNTQLAKLPRMADFALWATAAETAFGYKSGDFLSAFANKRKGAIQAGLDSNQVAVVLSEFMAERESWEGTMKQMLAELDSVAEDKTRNHKHWPQTPRKLGSELRRVATSFRTLGLDIQIEDSPQRDGYHLTITKACQESEASNKPSQTFTPSQETPKKVDLCEHVKVCEPKNITSDSIAHPITGNAVPVHYITELSEAVRELDVMTLTGEVIGADLETRPQAGHEGKKGAALSPDTGQARLLQLYDGWSVLVIDLDKVAIEDLSHYLTRSPLVFHNSDFDTAFLLAAGIDVDARCTQLETIALTAKNRPSLAWACEQFLGYQVDKEQQTSDWTGELTDNQLHYAAMDAVLVHALHQKLQETLTEKKITGYRLVQDCIKPIASARNHGVLLDVDRHQSLVDKWTAERDEAKARFLDIAGGIEPESPKQLAEWLSDNLEAGDLEDWPKTGKGQLSTDAETLKQFAHVPLVRPLLDYRHAGHRVKTWGHTYQRHLCSDGRIRPGFQLLGARTGRMSSQRPNVQNLPRDPEFRACFKVPDGYQLVAADYSQIELRIAGVLSGDNVIVSAYRSGVDLHKQIVHIFTGKPTDEITSAERKLGKAINFGLLYAGGAKTLQSYAQTNYGLDIILEQAEDYKKQFDQTYKKLRFWQLEKYRQHRGQGAFMSAGGRLITFRDKNNCFTDSRNYPIQGAAADLQMLAIARVHKHLVGKDVHLINFVHDELVLEVAEDRAEDVTSQLILTMTDAFLGLFGRFPVANKMAQGLVEVGIGLNYADAK